MAWLLFLHLEIDRCAMYPQQWRYWQNVQQYMQYANLNSGTPNFQNSYFGTICESWLFEITPFHMQNVFISKANHILNTKVLKWTLYLHETCCHWLKCQKLPHHPMQLLGNFDIEGKCIWQRLPDTTYEVLLSHFLLSMTDKLAYLEMQM